MDLPEWPGYTTTVEDTSTQRMVKLLTRHGVCDRTHVCKGVLDLRWAQSDAAYVDRVIDHMTHALGLAIEECGNG